MKRFLTLLATGALTLGLSATASAQLTRPFGAGALVLDDNHGNKVSITTPIYNAPPYFPVTTAYDAWEQQGFPVLNWSIPVPPFNNAQSGFLFSGPFNQTGPLTQPYTLTYWLGPGQTGFNNNGGYAGAWDYATIPQLFAGTADQGVTYNTVVGRYELGGTAAGNSTLNTGTNVAFSSDRFINTAAQTLHVVNNAGTDVASFNGNTSAVGLNTATGGNTAIGNTGTVTINGSTNSLAATTANNITGATNINTTTGNATNIGFGGTGVVAIGNLTGNVGIDVNNPVGELANTNVNPILQALGIASNGFNWNNSSVGGGWSAIINNTVAGAGHDGLGITIADQTNGSYAFYIQSNGVLMSVDGNGDVAIDPARSAATTIGNNVAGTTVGISGTTTINTGDADATTIGEIGANNSSTTINVGSGSTGLTLNGVTNNSATNLFLTQDGSGKVWTNAIGNFIQGTSGVLVTYPVAGGQAIAQLASTPGNGAAGTSVAFQGDRYLNTNGNTLHITNGTPSDFATFNGSTGAINLNTGTAGNTAIGNTGTVTINGSTNAIAATTANNITGVTNINSATANTTNIASNGGTGIVNIGNLTGRVGIGIGTAVPSTLLANIATGTNILSNDGDGETATSLTWQGTGGWTAVFDNNTNATSNDGVLVKILNTLATSTAFEVNSGAPTANGTVLFGIDGAGDVNIDPTDHATTSIGNNNVATNVAVLGTTNINFSANNPTSINTGTSSGTVSIGNNAASVNITSLAPTTGWSVTNAGVLNTAGSATIAVNAGTTNTFGNGGGATANQFGNGAATNNFGNSASNNNTFGNAAALNQFALAAPSNSFGDNNSATGVTNKFGVSESNTGTVTNTFGQANVVGTAVSNSIGGSTVINGTNIVNTTIGGSNAGTTVAITSTAIGAGWSVTGAGALSTSQTALIATVPGFSNTFGDGGGTTTNNIGNNAIAGTTTNNVGVNSGTGNITNQFGANSGAGTVTNSFGTSSSGPSVNTFGSATGGSSNTYVGLSSFTGNVVPTTDVTYTLGTPALRWQEVYAGPSSFHTIALASEDGGTLRNWGMGVVTGAGGGNLTFGEATGGANLMTLDPSGDVAALGNITTTEVGSSQASPRTVGIQNNFIGGVAGRVDIGDAVNSIQTGNALRTQLSSFYGFEVHGNTQGGSAVGFAAGAASDASLMVYPPAFGSDQQDWMNAAGTVVLASVKANGGANFPSVGATTAGTGAFTTLNSNSTTQLATTAAATTQIGNVVGFGNVTIGNNGAGTGQVNLNSGATGSVNVVGPTNINTSGAALTQIGTAGANTSIGAAGSTNTVLGTTNVTGATNINTSGAALTQIGTAGGSTSIGAAGSTNTVLGTTNVTGATNINTSGAALTQIGTAGGNTSIGAAGSTNTVLGATNVTGATTILGTTLINNSGAANTTIGNGGANANSVTITSGTTGGSGVAITSAPSAGNGWNVTGNGALNTDGAANIASNANIANNYFGNGGGSTTNTIGDNGTAASLTTNNIGQSTLAGASVSNNIGNFGNGTVTDNILGAPVNINTPAGATVWSVATNIDASPASGGSINIGNDNGTKSATAADGVWTFSQNPIFGGLNTNDIVFTSNTDQLTTSNNLSWNNGSSTFAVEGTTQINVANASNNTTSINTTSGTGAVAIGNAATTSITLTAAPGATITASSLNTTPIGTTTPAAGDFTSIGVASQGTGAFTTLSGSTSITDGGLTAGDVTFAGVGGILSNSNNFTWGGNTLTVTGAVTNTGDATLGTGAAATANSFGTNATVVVANTIGSSFAGSTNQINGATTFGGTVAAGANQVSGSNFSITGGSINGTTVGATTPAAGDFTSIGVASQGTGAFTTLSGSTSITDGGLTAGDVTFAGVGGILSNSNNFTWGGNTLTVTGAVTNTGDATLGTGAAATANSFGTNATVVVANTIGSSFAGSTNQINGATTFGGTVAAGANQVSGSNFSITGGSINGTTVGATAASTGAFTTLSASGAITTTKIVNPAATYTATTSDYIVLESANASTVTLPATPATGEVMIVKFTDPNPGDQMTVSGGAKTIDGAASWTLYSTANSPMPSGFTMVYDGTQWDVTSSAVE